MKTNINISRLARVFAHMALFALLIVLYFVLTSSRRAERTDNRMARDILNGYHNVTKISMEYNDNIFWFSGDNLEPVKTLLNPLLGRFIYGVNTDVTDGAVSARFRHYVEDKLLFSSTISEAPFGTQRSFSVVHSDDSVVLFSAVFIDGTRLITSIYSSGSLSILHLISLAAE